MRSCLLAFAVSMLSLTAQGSITVPATAVGRDGLGLSHLAGVADSRRQQFIVGESLLPGLRGHQITGISFRRDGQPAVLRAGQANLRVLLAQGSLTDAWKATPSFDTNLGAAPTTVFEGQVSAPASARPTTRDGVGFGASETITITFSQPFTYTGGTLCLDVAGAPVTGSTLRAWPIDVDRDGVRGQVTVLARAASR